MAILSSPLKKCRAKKVLNSFPFDFLLLFPGTHSHYFPANHSANPKSPCAFPLWNTNHASRVYFFVFLSLWSSGTPQGIRLRHTIKFNFSNFNFSPPLYTFSTWVSSLVVETPSGILLAPANKWKLVANRHEIWCWLILGSQSGTLLLCSFLRNFIRSTSKAFNIICPKRIMRTATKPLRRSLKRHSWPLSPSPQTCCWTPKKTRCGAQKAC